MIFTMTAVGHTVLCTILAKKLLLNTGPHFMIASNSTAIFGHNLASCILSSWLFLNDVFEMLLHLSKTSFFW